MKIRKAKKDDLNDLWEIEIESRRHHKKVNPKKYSLLNKTKIDNKNKKEFFKWIGKDLKSKKNLLLVAEDNEKIVGAILGFFGKWFWSDRSPKIAKINDLGVLKKYQKKGIATKLIKEFEKIALQKGVKFIHFSVWVKNNPAIKAYRKNKYEDFTIEMVKKLK